MSHGSSLSAALCRGLIEADRLMTSGARAAPRFPRLYAAASLKRDPARGRRGGVHRLSAALCRGLIEAGEAARGLAGAVLAFRGFMPRPH